MCFYLEPHDGACLVNFAVKFPSIFCFLKFSLSAKMEAWFHLIHLPGADSVFAYDRFGRG